MFNVLGVASTAAVIQKVCSTTGADPDSITSNIGGSHEVIVHLTTVDD